jgi:hypothetical protein
MSVTTAHIISHTHWDREWFLTSVYTSRWIPGLVDELDKLVEANPDFRFLFDGQTLVVEDLLRVAPGYEEKIRKLVGQHRLQIGPYYSQPDWQLTTGELLIRNLVYGKKDLAAYGGKMQTGWMVDTFGHVGQSPQIHQMFGIDALFVWRGVPKLEPYFTWQGSDGSQLLTINLFGGYRNLYGVSHAPEVAAKRVESEVDKLLPFYPTADIPLFDGYDLEDNPEDPLRFLAALGGVRGDIKLQEATPAGFAKEIKEKILDLPLIKGELNSGKYGATFPGVFSARTYLKVMAHDCERMLFKVCEPLAVLAFLHGRAYDGELYEHWGRRLLRNGVHDCICGVSIDQVHEKMAFSYKRAFEDMQADAYASLMTIFERYAPGTYVVSTNPFAHDGWLVTGDDLAHVRTDGIGVWEVLESVPLIRTDIQTDLFVWANAYYEARISGDGLVEVRDAVLGKMIVAAEHGDTYSEELGESLGRMEVTSGLRVEYSSDHHALLSFTAIWQNEDIEVTGDVRLILDESPLIKWEIDLDSRGKDFRVEMLFQTGMAGELKAGMPYDCVSRPLVDEDLLPRELPVGLARVLLGQRELNKVSMFPFHDYLGISDGEMVTAVLAKGLRSYRAEEEGVIILPLRRSVEWLTAANLENRVGDAGPFFYVPDARCERRVKHEVAVAVGVGDLESSGFQSLNAYYQNPPLVVDVEAKGSLTGFRLLQEDVPLGALLVQSEQVMARFFNPAGQEQPLSKMYVTVDVWGEAGEKVDLIGPKQISTLRLDVERVARESQPEESSILLRAVFPEWRVGKNRGRPDPAIMVGLEHKVAERQAEIARLKKKMADAEGTERLLIQHRIYVLQREGLEFQLSYLLNERKLLQDGSLNEAYLYEPDAEIAEMGLALNRLRIKRRIYDYVVEAAISR